MLPIQVRIQRAQRLLRMLEEDAPLLAVRVAQLTRDRQESAKRYAAELTAQTRAELLRLQEEGSLVDANLAVPQPAD